MEFTGTGDLLRKMRLIAGLTQENMASKMHMSRSTISRLENEEIEIRITDFWDWVKTTQGQDMLITFLMSADIITSMPTIINTVLSIF